MRFFLCSAFFDPRARRGELWLRRATFSSYDYYDQSALPRNLERPDHTTAPPAYLRRAHSCITMPAATVTGSELLTP